MVLFLRSAGKLFQACEAAYEIRLLPYVVVLTFGTTNVIANGCIWLQQLCYVLQGLVLSKI